MTQADTILRDPADLGDQQATPARRRLADRRWQGVVSIAVFLLIWQLIADLKLVAAFSLPPFTTVVAATWDLAKSGLLWSDVSVSLLRAGIGFALAIVVGIGVGLAIGWSGAASRWLSAPMEFFRQLPPLAIYPVFLLFLGLGLRSQIAMVFWGSVWPILLNTINGCQQVDTTLTKAARSYGVSRWQMFTKVVLPSAVPVISTGVRLGGTYALLVLVGAEMIGAQNGIGFLILNSQNTLEVPDMYAGILVLACLGLILNFVLLRLEKRITRWRLHA